MCFVTFFYHRHYCCQFYQCIYYLSLFLSWLIMLIFFLIWPWHVRQMQLDEIKNVFSLKDKNKDDKNIIICLIKGEYKMWVQKKKSIISLFPFKHILSWDRQLLLIRKIDKLSCTKILQPIWGALVWVAKRERHIENPKWSVSNN